MIRAAALLAAASLTAATAGASDRIDLAVVEISAAGLCIGARNRAEVTIANRGDAVAGPGFEVALTVQLPGHPPARLTSVARAVAPGERLRIAFERIVVDEPAEVLLRAEVDPDHSLDDSDRSNNTAAVLEPVSDPCDPTVVRWPPMPRNDAYPVDVLVNHTAIRHQQGGPACARSFRFS